MPCPFDISYLKRFTARSCYIGSWYASSAQNMCVCVCDGDDGDIAVDDDEADGHDVSITFFTSIPLRNF